MALKVAHGRGRALFTQGLLSAGLAILFLTSPWYLWATCGYYEMVLGRTRQPTSPLPRQRYQTPSSKCNSLQGFVSDTHPKAEVDMTTQSAITGELLMRSNPIYTGSSSPPHFTSLAGFAHSSSQKRHKPDHSGSYRLPSKAQHVGLSTTAYRNLNRYVYQKPFPLHETVLSEHENLSSCLIQFPHCHLASATPCPSPLCHSCPN